MIEIKLRGKVVGKGRDLGVILRYARRIGYLGFVDAVTIARRPGGKGWLYVLWSDGAVAETEFADFAVLLEWLGNRRSWQNARLVYKGEVMNLNRSNLHIIAVRNQT